MQDKYINPSLLEASLGCSAGAGEETERGSAERRKRVSKPRDQGEPKCLDYAVRGRGSSAHWAGEFRVEGRVYQPPLQQVESKGGWETWEPVHFGPKGILVAFPGQKSNRKFWPALSRSKTNPLALVKFALGKF